MGSLSARLGAMLLLVVCTARTGSANNKISKCFACEFDSKNCPILADCPQNRDICTVGKFNPWVVPQVDCHTGCETFLVTDPTGNIVKWRRGCSQSPYPVGSTAANICITEYNFGIRVDKCTCRGHLCNGVARSAAINTTFLVMSFLLAFAYKKL